MRAAEAETGVVEGPAVTEAGVVSARTVAVASRGDHWGRRGDWS